VTTGTLVVVMIAVLVVATTPRSSNQPSSMTATTMPAFVVTTPVAIVRADPQPRRAPEPTVQPTLQLASLVAIPNEIAAAPQFAGQEQQVAEDPPTASQQVMVQTDDVTYHCTWAEVAEQLLAHDGAIVVDLDGALVAHVDDGELVEVAGLSDD